LVPDAVISGGPGTKLTEEQMMYLWMEHEYEKRITNPETYEELPEDFHLESQAEQSKMS